MWVKNDEDGKTYWINHADYFATARLSEYFGYPLTKPFKLPQHVNEKVKVEKLPHKNLPEWNPSEPILRKMRVNGRVRECQVVLGYREIYKKRQRIEYLKELAEEVERKQMFGDKLEEDIILGVLVAPGGGGGGGNQKKKKKSGPTKKQMKEKSMGTKGGVREKKKRRSGGKTIKKRKSGGKKKPKKGCQEKICIKIRATFCGGKKKQRKKKPSGKGKRKSDKSHKTKKPSDKSRKTKKPSDESRKTKKPSDKSRKPKKPSDESEKRKQSDDSDKKKQSDDSKRTSDDSKSKSKGDSSLDDEDTESVLLYAEVEQQKRARRNSSSFSFVAPTRDKCEIEQEFHEPKPDFSLVNQIEAARQAAIDTGKPIVRQLSLGSHYMVLRQAGHQRDNEWLQLSPSTDQDEEYRKIRLKRLRSAHEPWMDPGLGYACQKLFRSLQLFFFALTLTMRNPFIIQPCYRNRIPMVHVFRKRMIIFSFSTLLIWMVLGFLVINSLDLMYGTEEGDIYQQVERSELELYYIPILAVAINILLAAFWSLLVLLHYCLVLANYFNLWSRAMPFLDMNPSFSLAKYMRIHLACFIVYVLIICVSFTYNWPVVTRGTFGQLFILFCRQMWPKVRLLPDRHFFWGQLAGCFVYLYCVWVNRTIFMYMHAFSILLRNACYQWNLNFAIRFQLIVTYYRAHLLRIATQGNVIRLYNQHRLIVGLCNYYGKVFLHPMCIYMVTNMTVCTLILIYFIKYEEEDPKGFDFVYHIVFSENSTGAESVIFHTLPKQDELTAVVFVFLQCVIDFVVGTIGISWGSQAIQQSFEFVRRHGLIQCNTQHERRLIQSLYMSFGNPRSPLITADNYFGMTKAKIFSGFMMMAFFWTMIIQCQDEAPSALIEWVSNTSGQCNDLPLYEDDFGRFFCMKGHKMRMKMKNRTRRIRLLEILQKDVRYDWNVNYWFFDNCEDEELSQAKPVRDKFGICRIMFSGTREEFAELKMKFPRYINEQTYKQILAKWSETFSSNWTSPTAIEFQTDSPYPCKVQGKFSWKAYYRDFFARCFSKIHNRTVMVPIMFRDDPEARAAKTVPHYELDLKVTENRLRDCAVNPFPMGTDLTTCDGRKGSQIVYDDCGSPNILDFSFTGGTVGSFTIPSYHSEPMELSILPDPYLLAGLPKKRYIRCWNTLTALEKCKNKDFLLYCRLGRIPTSVEENQFGYLFGKACYDFVDFTVYQTPNVYFFCKHPAPHPHEMETIPLKQWISEEAINKTIESWGDWDKFRTFPPKQERKRRDLSLRSFTSQTQPRRSSNSYRNKNGSRKKRAAHRKEDEYSYAALTVKEILGQQYSMFNAQTMTQRSILLTEFFPCKDRNRVIQGWLPIPRIVLKNKTEVHLPPKDIQEKMRDNGECWDNPYEKMIMSDVKSILGGSTDEIQEILDPFGKNFLDDCHNPWFMRFKFGEYWVPDVVFHVPDGKMMERGDFHCWDFIPADSCSGNCLKTTHDKIS